MNKKFIYYCMFCGKGMVSIESPSSYEDHYVCLCGAKLIAVQPSTGEDGGYIWLMERKRK